MLEKVKTRDVRPNPFQARKSFDREGIESLAKEIKAVGLWPGALRGRRKGSQIELCFGHRRFEAVKHLGWSEVEVDIVELTDDEMATQSLIENLQREGLNDVEKAEGIVSLVKQVQRSGKIDQQHAIGEVASKLGLSSAWTRDLMKIAGFDEAAKDAIRKRQIAGRTAMEAHRIGGSEMVKIAVSKKLPVHTLTAIGQRLGEIRDPKVREKVKQDVLKGQLFAPDDIQKRARRLAAKGQKNPPPDLIVFIVKWTQDMREWNSRLDGFLQKKREYLDYIDNQPKVAENFRTSVKDLISRLQQLL